MKGQNHRTQVSTVELKLIEGQTANWLQDTQAGLEGRVEQA